MRIDPRQGKESETHFRVLERGEKCSLVEARPVTGRTHQIRIHLAECGHPVVGDELYGSRSARGARLGLRAVELAYADPFTRREVRIQAPTEEFLGEYNLSTQPAGRLSSRL